MAGWAKEEEEKGRLSWGGGAEAGEEQTHHICKYISYTEDAEPKLRSLKVSDISMALHKPLISLQHSSPCWETSVDETREIEASLYIQLHSLGAWTEATAWCHHHDNIIICKKGWTLQSHLEHTNLEHTDRHACCQTDMQVVRQTDTHTGLQTQTCRSSDRQIDRHAGC